MPETVDKARARRLLEHSLAAADDGDMKYLGIQKPKGPVRTEDDTVPFTTQMMNLRN